MLVQAPYKQFLYYTEDNILAIKLTILGNGQVGKTSLASVVASNDFPLRYDMTVGVEIHTTNVLLGPDQQVRLVMWDMAGQEHFDSVRPVFYEGAHAAMVVFDLQNRGSFYDVHGWIRELWNHAPGTPFILVGNKMDLPQRDVHPEEARQLALQYRVPYIETSAKTRQNVHEAFQLAAAAALQRLSQ